jgi:hypothetical protein
MNSINGTGNPLLSTTVAKAMLTNVGEGDTYGLGLGLEIQNNEVVSFFHTGGNMGYRCAFQAFLNNESCIVVIPNAETGEDLMMEALRGATRRYEALRGATRRYEALRGATRRYEALRGATRRYEAPKCFRRISEQNTALVGIFHILFHSFVWSPEVASLVIHTSTQLIYF